MTSAVDGRVTRARDLERAGDLDAAEALCDAVLSESPTDVDALLTRGAIHARRGERMSALGRFREAAHLAPDRADIAYLVASVGGADMSAPMRGEIVELFDRYAPRFDAHLTGELGYRGHRLVAEALEPFAPLGTVLDLGCGTGLCGPLLRRLARRLEGVDLSPEMVARARETGVYDAVEVGDVVYALSVRPPGAVDALTAADVFGYVGHLDAVFVACAKALRPGGVLVFSVERSDGADRVLGPSRRYAFAPGWVAERLAEANLVEVRRIEEVLRVEDGAPVAGDIWVARR